MNKLATISATALSDTRIDFNIKSVATDFILYIDSDKALTLALKDGVGVDDPLETEGSSLNYVLTGSAVPVYDGTATSYTIVADVVKKIIIKRAEVGDWISLVFTNATTVAEVNLYAKIS